MVRLELRKVNNSFDKLAASLREYKFLSLSSLYDTLVPWYMACNEIQYPKLYTLFTGDEEEFQSWEEIEDYLPYMSLQKITNNKIVLEAEDELINNYFLLCLAVHSETDLTLISEGELLIDDGYIDNVKFIMKLNDINFSFFGNIVKLEHIKR